jgi:NTE family protein
MDSIVLALGGGGARGLAHIGVIRQLEQAGFHIAAIAGTSAGAIVGAIYAAGYNTDQIETVMAEIGQRDFFARTHDDGPSLMGLSGLRRALQTLIGDKTFTDLMLPFACTAVDIKTDQELIITHGPVMDAVQASAAVPGIFPPIRMGSYELVDGGVLDPVPVSVARWLAPNHPIVAVCLHPIPEQWGQLPALSITPPTPIPVPSPVMEQFSRLRIAQALRIFAHSMDITARMVAELRLQIDKPDVIIRPEVGEYGLLETSNPDLLVQKGELAASLKIEEIRRAFSLRQAISRRFRSPQLTGKLIDGEEPLDDPEGAMDA